MIILYLMDHKVIHKSGFFHEISNASVVPDTQVMNTLIWQYGKICYASEG